MKTSFDIRIPKQTFFHRFGLHAFSLFVALAGIVVAAPIDPSERVAPKIGIAGGKVKVTIEPSVDGRIYQLQVSDNLTDPSWQNIEKQVVGDGNNLTITTPLIPGAPRRFFRVTFTDGFSLVPAGLFTMGRTSGDADADAPPVSVNVSDFYMGRHEVTKAQWSEVQAWAVQNGYAELPAGAGKASDHPVHSVSWHDVLRWCNARSEKERLKPVYTVNGEVMRTGTAEPTVDWTANGYRLPTEAEWEKAARGGVAGKRYPWGADTISHAEANYSGTDSSFGNQSVGVGYHPSYVAGGVPYTAPVSSFAPNAYGLYGMAGNVFEWCWDRYSTTSYVNGATDPRGSATGSSRVFRGGTWFLGANRCRASDRNFNAPSLMNEGVGFRVARSAGQ